MKLHNLITDEICEAEAREDGIYVKANWSDDGKWFLYDLHTLASCWEYYVEPKKPLIKDEKIRKAVRAWAEANNIQVASFYASPSHWFLRAFNDGEQGIDFWLRCEDNPKLIESKRYTIAELCGENDE